MKNSLSVTSEMIPVPMWSLLHPTLPSKIKVTSCIQNQKKVYQNIGSNQNN